MWGKRTGYPQRVDPFGYPMPKANQQPLAISPLFLAPPTPFSHLHDNEAFSMKGGWPNFRVLAFGSKKTKTQKT